MQITFTIDDQLIEQATRLAGTHDLSQVITLALKEFVQTRSTQPPKRNLLDLAGQVEIDPDYDYKKLRLGK